MIKVHAGVVWVVSIKSGWYWLLKAFPQAIKKIDKDNYAPDIDHPTVLKYIKDMAT